MMTRGAKAALVLVAMVLAVAVAVQFRPATRTLPGKGRHLAEFFPGTLRGWTVRELPLGPSEGVTGQIEKTLRFDDVLYREYARPGTGSISVYVAYWEPGKMPAQLVASHTPDRCWTEAGWTCRAQGHEVVADLGGTKLRPAQERLFENTAAKKQHVLFWHLVGDGLYDYGERFYYVPSPWKWWRDAVRQMWGRPQEQYFVRLSSDVPWESWQSEAGVVEIVEGLRKMGLEARGSPTS